MDNSNMNFNQFLLLGLRIDKGCEKHIRKNLEIGVIYPFYRYFKDYNPKNSSIEEFDPLPSDFFMEKENGLPLISICGIVGKNGSGKSSLIDIILRLLNNLSYSLNETYKIIHSFCFITGVRASMYYSLGDEVFCLSQKGDDQKDIKLSYWNKTKWSAVSISKKFLGTSFFYSVLVNYSIHAFNLNDYARDIDASSNKNINWLDACFHKNDGYTAPLVLNPKRTKGNIDINIENHLAKSRLLSLIFVSIDDKGKKHKDSNPYLYINQKLTISKISLGLDTKSVEEKYDNIFKNWKEHRPVYSDDIRMFVHNTIVDEWEKLYKFKTTQDELYNLAIKYLVYKTISTVETYDAFENFQVLTLSYSLYGIETEEKRKEWREAIGRLIKEIDEDPSHITFRLKQTLFFLKYRHYQIKEQKETEISIATFSEIPSQYKLDSTRDMSLLAPPPIFKTKIFVKDNETGEEFLFSQLSSGERQLAYAVSTIIYHLRNLNSVPQNIRRIKYRYVNIILDEIELYFHPGYQRSFINHLLMSLRSARLHDIWALNIMVITHSPFILSDIPKSNVLFLKDGKPEYGMQENTFASNIHSLLQNGFFMEDGTMGEFARGKVNELFGQLQQQYDSEYDEGGYQEKIYRNILLVSEPILRSQLLRMYNERYGTEREIRLLRQEINSLRNELQNLKNDKNSKG